MRKVNLQGNEAKLWSRRFLLKKLICRELETLMTLSKNALKSMSADLALPFGAGASKDDSIANASNAMISNHNDAVE